MDNVQEASEQRRTGSASPWSLPRLILIGDGFTDSECADRIVDAVGESSDGVFGKAPELTLWVHLRDRTAPAGLFQECAARLVERLRNASPSILLSVNGRPEVAESLQCGYHAGVRDAAPAFSCGPRQPCGRSVHNPDEARAAMGGDHQNRYQGSVTGGNPRAIASNPREGEGHRPQYLFFSPVFNPQGKPGYVGAGIDALHDFVQYVQRRVPVYALGGVTPDRVGPCLDAGSYGVAVLSGIMMADHPGQAASAYLSALRAYFETTL